MNGAAPTQQRTARAEPTARREARGPISGTFGVLVGLVFATLTSFFFGVAIELIGLYTIWQDEGVGHAQRTVQEDFGYLQEFPRSLLVDDTVGFAAEMSAQVTRPFHWIHAPEFIERARGERSGADANAALGPDLPSGRVVLHEAGRWVEIAIYVAQDTAIRLAIALYALPTFAMAILIGLVDGLVRRDLRKWSGGRESSFIYHHAKRFFFWFLTAGFTAYLAWPFGGINPAHLVLLFAVGVAAALSTTVSSFKKYL